MIHLSCDERYEKLLGQHLDLEQALAEYKAMVGELVKTLGTCKYAMEIHDRKSDNIYHITCETLTKAKQLQESTK